MTSDCHLTSCRHMASSRHTFLKFLEMSKRKSSAKHKPSKKTRNIAKRLASLYTKLWHDLVAFERINDPDDPGPECIKTPTSGKCPCVMCKAGCNLSIAKKHVAKGIRQRHTEILRVLALQLNKLMPYREFCKYVLEDIHRTIDGHSVLTLRFPNVTCGCVTCVCSRDLVKALKSIIKSCS